MSRSETFSRFVDFYNNTPCQNSTLEITFVQRNNIPLDFDSFFFLQDFFFIHFIVKIKLHSFVFEFRVHMNTWNVNGGRGKGFYDGEWMLNS